MPRAFPLVQTLELLGAERRGLTEPQLRAKAFPGLPPRTVRRVLTRLRGFAIIRSRKVQKVVTGRRPRRWELNRNGLAVLDLLGSNSERYGANWTDIQRLAGAVKTLRRLGSLSPKKKSQAPAWTLNRAYFE